MVSAVNDKGHLRADIAEGLRAVFGDRVMRAVTLAATVGAFGGQMQNVVLILFFVRDAGVSPALVGVLIAIAGVAAVAGALLATPITARLGPGRAFIAGMLLASTSKHSGNRCSRLKFCPGQTGAGGSWVYGMQVFGALPGGVLGSALGLRKTLIISSVVMLSGVVIAYSSPLRTLQSLPAEPASEVTSAA